jgi:hypoxanthine phosphoribosyltransferase
MSGDRQVKVLFDERTIAERTEALAREIAAAKPKDLLVVAILKGSFMFAADLLRALHRVGLEPQVEFFHLSSYLSGTVSSGTVKILRDMNPRFVIETFCWLMTSSNRAAPWRSPRIF